MGKFTRGEVVIVKFPFSDLSQSKLRPALVLAEAEYEDLLLCQITSKTYGDRNAVELNRNDFNSGSLPLQSYIRPGRILTGSSKIVSRSVGSLKASKHQEVVDAITRLLN